jgi:hypothetical protein
LRYLNKIFLYLCFFSFTCGFAHTAEGRDPKDAGEAVSLFGYPFASFSNFGVSNYFEYQSNGEHIQVTVVKMPHYEVAEIFMDDRLAQFRSVFEARRVDYPGQYSKSIHCPLKFQPEFVKLDVPDGHFKYFSGYAGINKVAGACSADLIVYRHIYGLVLCKRSNYVLEIERFANDLDEVQENFIRQVNCDKLPIMKF